jgi:hypothetical protein
MNNVNVFNGAQSGDGNASEGESISVPPHRPALIASDPLMATMIMSLQQLPLPQGFSSSTAHAHVFEQYYANARIATIISPGSLPTGNKSA